MANYLRPRAEDEDIRDRANTSLDAGQAQVDQQADPAADPEADTSLQTRAAQYNLNEGKRQAYEAKVRTADARRRNRPGSEAWQNVANASGDKSAAQQATRKAAEARRDETVTADASTRLAQNDISRQREEQQLAAAQKREQDQQNAADLRKFEAAGGETQVDPATGEKAPAFHPDGAPRFKPGAIEGEKPRQQPTADAALASVPGMGAVMTLGGPIDQTTELVQPMRDDRGGIADVPLEQKTDPKTGEIYSETKDQFGQTQRVNLGQDTKIPRLNQIQTEIDTRAMELQALDVQRAQLEPAWKPVEENYKKAKTALDAPLEFIQENGKWVENTPQRFPADPEKLANWRQSRESTLQWYNNAAKSYGQQAPAMDNLQQQQQEIKLRHEQAQLQKKRVELDLPEQDGGVAATLTAAETGQLPSEEAATADYLKTLATGMPGFGDAFLTANGQASYQQLPALPDGIDLPKTRPIIPQDDPGKAAMISKAFNGVAAPDQLMLHDDGDGFTRVVRKDPNPKGTNHNSIGNMEIDKATGIPRMVLDPRWAPTDILSQVTFGNTDGIDIYLREPKNFTFNPAKEAEWAASIFDALSRNPDPKANNEIIESMGAGPEQILAKLKGGELSVKRAEALMQNLWGSTLKAEDPSAPGAFDKWLYQQTSKQNRDAWTAATVSRSTADKNAVLQTYMDEWQSRNAWKPGVTLQQRVDFEKKLKLTPRTTEQIAGLADSFAITAIQSVAMLSQLSTPVIAPVNAVLNPGDNTKWAEAVGRATANDTRMIGRTATRYATEEGKQAFAERDTIAELLRSTVMTQDVYPGGRESPEWKAAMDAAIRQATDNADKIHGWNREDGWEITREDLDPATNAHLRKLIDIYALTGNKDYLDSFMAAQLEDHGTRQTAKYQLDLAAGRNKYVAAWVQGTHASLYETATEVASTALTLGTGKVLFGAGKALTASKAAAHMVKLEKAAEAGSRLAKFRLAMHGIKADVLKAGMVPDTLANPATRLGKLGNAASKVGKFAVATGATGALEEGFMGLARPDASVPNILHDAMIGAIMEPLLGGIMSVPTVAIGSAIQQSKVSRNVAKFSDAYNREFNSSEGFVPITPQKAQAAMALFDGVNLNAFAQRLTESAANVKIAVEAAAADTAGPAEIQAMHAAQAAHREVIDSVSESIFSRLEAVQHVDSVQAEDRPLAYAIAKVAAGRADLVTPQERAAAAGALTPQGSPVFATSANGIDILTDEGRAHAMSRFPGVGMLIQTAESERMFQQQIAAVPAAATGQSDPNAAPAVNPVSASQSGGAGPNMTRVEIDEPTRARSLAIAQQTLERVKLTSPGLAASVSLVEQHPIYTSGGVQMNFDPDSPINIVPDDIAQFIAANPEATDEQVVQYLSDAIETHEVSHVAQFEKSKIEAAARGLTGTDVENFHAIYNERAAQYQAESPKAWAYAAELYGRGSAAKGDPLAGWTNLQPWAQAAEIERMFVESLISKDGKPSDASRLIGEAQGTLKARLLELAQFIADLVTGNHRDAQGNLVPIPESLRARAQEIAATVEAIRQGKPINATPSPTNTRSTNPAANPGQSTPGQTAPGTGAAPQANSNRQPANNGGTQQTPGDNAGAPAATAEQQARVKATEIVRKEFDKALASRPLLKKDADLMTGLREAAIDIVESHQGLPQAEIKDAAARAIGIYLQSPEVSEKLGALYAAQSDKAKAYRAAATARVKEEARRVIGQRMATVRDLIDSIGRITRPTNALELYRTGQTLPPEWNGMLRSSDYAGGGKNAVVRAILGMIYAPDENSGSSPDSIAVGLEREFPDKYQGMTPDMLWTALQEEIRGYVNGADTSALDDPDADTSGMTDDQIQALADRHAKAAVVEKWRGITGKSLLPATAEAYEAEYQSIVAAQGENDFLDEEYQQQAVAAVDARKPATPEAPPKPQAASKPQGSPDASPPVEDDGSIFAAVDLGNEVVTTPTESDQAAAEKWVNSMPGFQGGKRPMAAPVTAAVRAAFSPEKRSSFRTIVDFFGGGGSWGLFHAMVNFDNVNRVVVYERNADRLLKIKLFHEKGNLVAGMLQQKNVQDILANAAAKMRQSATKSGSALAKRIDTSGISDPLLLGLFQAIRDYAENSYAGAKDKAGEQTPEQKIAISIRIVGEQAAEAYRLAEAFRQRGGKVDYRNADSYQAAPESGTDVLSIIDPPYYRTKGYTFEESIPDMASGEVTETVKENTVREDTYRLTRDLIQRSAAAGNAMIYTDSAFWKMEETEKRGKKTITHPPYFGMKEQHRRYYLPEGGRILSDIVDTFDSFGVVAGEIGAGRKEILGIHGHDITTQPGRRTRPQRNARNNEGQGSPDGRNDQPAGRGGNSGQAVPGMAGRTAAEASPLRSESGDPLNPGDEARLGSAPVQADRRPGESGKDYYQRITQAPVVRFEDSRIVHHTTGEKAAEAIAAGQFQTGADLGVAEKRGAVYFADEDVNPGIYARNDEGGSYEGQQARTLPIDIRGLALLNNEYAPDQGYPNHQQYGNNRIRGEFDMLPPGVDGYISFLDDGRIYEVALPAQTANKAREQNRLFSAPAQATADFKRAFTPLDPKNPFGDWSASTTEPGILTGYRGENGNGQADNNFGSSEGVGLYLAKTRQDTEFFGKARQVNFPKPKNPLVVDQDATGEPIPLLQEDNEAIWDHIWSHKPSPQDSDWIKAHVLAAKQLGMTQENSEGWDTKLPRALTDILLTMGYDAVYVRSGGMQWVNILAKPGQRFNRGTRSAAGAALYSAPAQNPDFYSPLERAIEAKLPANAPLEQIAGIVRNNARPEEIKWSGILPAAERIARDNNGKVPKVALLEYLRNEGALKLEEVVIQDDRGEGFTVEESDGVWVVKNRDGLAVNFGKTREEAEQWKAQYEGSGIGRATKWASHTVPGGENYRETVLSIGDEGRLDASGYGLWITKGPESGQYVDDPEKGSRWVFSTEQEAQEMAEEMSDDEMTFEAKPIKQDRPAYISPHFPDISGYIAHMRVNERADASGKRGLLVETLQSDRHQSGKDLGYKGEVAAVAAIDNLTREQAIQIIKRNENGNDTLEGDESLEDLRGVVRYYLEEEGQDETGETFRFLKNLAGTDGVADAPFRKDWHVQLFKRALRDAVSKNLEWVGWTDGSTQVDRWHRTGKEADAMRTFYDKVIPQDVNRYVKQWGTKVEKSQLDLLEQDDLEWEMQKEYDGRNSVWEVFNPNSTTTEDSRQFTTKKEAQAFIDSITSGPSIWRVAITPEMRSSVAQGQALFSAPAQNPAVQNPAVQYRYLKDKEAKAGLTPAEQQALLQSEKAMGQSFAIDMDDPALKSRSKGSVSPSFQPQLNLQRQHPVTGQQLALFSSPAQQGAARHAVLEAKHNAGTITPTEREEAQRMVDAAAKAAGYAVTVFHGSPNRGITEFQYPTYTSRSTFMAEQYAGDFNYEGERTDGRVYPLVVKPGKTLKLWQHRDWVDVVEKLPASIGDQVKELLVKYSANIIDETSRDLKWIRPTWDDLKSRMMKARSYRLSGDAGYWNQDGYDLAATYRKGFDESSANFTNQSDLVDLLFSAGYDTLSQLEGGDKPSESATYIVKDSNRIKSAEPFTGVPLSERFNPQSPSILMSAPAQPVDDAAALDAALKGMDPIYLKVFQASQRTPTPTPQDLAAEFRLPERAIANIIGTARTRIMAHGRTIRPGGLTPARTADGRLKGGMPERANSTTPILAAVDQIQQQEGLPLGKTANEIHTAGYAILQRPDATQHLLDAHLNGIPNEGQIFATAQLLLEAGIKGEQSPALTELALLYRQRGTEQSDAFRARIDIHRTPAERNALIFQELFTSPNKQVQKAWREAKTPEQKAAILQEWNARVKGVKEALKARGLDLQDAMDRLASQRTDAKAAESESSAAHQKLVDALQADVARLKAQLAAATDEAAKAATQTQVEAAQEKAEQAAALDPSNTIRLELQKLNKMERMAIEDLRDGGTWESAAYFSLLSVPEVKRVFDKFADALDDAGARAILLAEDILLDNQARLNSPAANAMSREDRAREGAAAIRKALGYDRNLIDRRSKGIEPKPKKGTAKKPAVARPEPADMTDAQFQAYLDNPQTWRSLWQAEMIVTGEETSFDQWINKPETRARKTRLTRMSKAPVSTFTGELDMHDPMSVKRAADEWNIHSASLFDKAVSIWRMGILSGIHTGIVNFGGNVAHSQYNLWPRRLMEAGVNNVLSALGLGSKEAATFGELKYMAQAQHKAMARAGTSMVLSWNMDSRIVEEEVLAMGKQWELGTHVGADEFQKVVGGPLGKLLHSISFRHMTAADEMIKAYHSQTEVMAQAYRMAKAEKLTGEAFDKRMDELLEYGSPAWVKAMDSAKWVTFQNQVDPKNPRSLAIFDRAAHALRRMAHTDTGKTKEIPDGKGKMITVPIMKPNVFAFFFPFINTPLNIMKIGIEMSPVGAFFSTVDALRALKIRIENKSISPEQSRIEASELYNRLRLVQDLTNQIIGMGMFYALGSLVKPDDDEELPWITGSTDWKSTSKGDRDLRARVMPAYTLRVPFTDAMLTYQRIEPFGTALGFIIDARIAVNRKGWSDEALGEFMATAINQFNDKTYMKGLSDLMTVWNDPERIGTRLTSSIVTGFVPNLIRQPIREADPYMRDTKPGADVGFVEGVWHNIKYSLAPGYAPIAQDVWGNPIKRHPGQQFGNVHTDVLLRVFDPTNLTVRDQIDPLDLYLFNWNNTAATPKERFNIEPIQKNLQIDRGGKTTTVQLSPEDHAAANRNAGQAARQFLGNDWDASNPQPQQVERVKEVLQKFQKRERDRLRDKYRSALPEE